MSLNGSGVFVVNSAGQPVVAATLIDATVFNAFTADVATALSTALYKDGQQVPTANIPMGGYRMTGMGAGIAATDSANMSQLSSGAAVYVSGVGGTANAITLTPSPAISAYAAGQIFRFIVGTTNTGAVTIATSALTARNLKKRTSGGLVAVVANDLIAGCEYAIYDDGTQYILEGVRVYSQGADVASSGTINLNTTTGDYVHITGTTAITAITLAQGEERTIVFDGILTFTNGASLILPGAASITTAANDIAVVRGEASGVVRCVSYIKASGAPIVSTVAPLFMPLSANLAANALTATLASGAVLHFNDGTSVTTSGALTVTASSGSTLGTVSGVASRIWVVAVKNSGTPELALRNNVSGTSIAWPALRSTITTVAEGGAGAADSAQTFYSTTLRASQPWCVVGYIDSTQATAGTWATALTLVQDFGPGIPMPGTPVQIQTSVTSTYSTGANATPAFDNTIPQITEGDQVLTVSIAPTSASNILAIAAKAAAACTVAADLSLSVFQTGTNDALGAVASAVDVASLTTTLSVEVSKVANFTTSTAITGRIGNSAGTYYFNGKAAAQLWGGVSNSYIQVTEIQT